MDIAIRREITALRAIGFNSCFFVTDDSCSAGSPFIHCYVPGLLCVDVYSWGREVSGVGNDGRDWDVDEMEAAQLVMPFIQTREGFRRAYRLARLCVQLPRMWRLN
ncbi:hypothetical protein [Cedecea sp. NFIX57]|uniref:hypothetical protein n=1 Tax=Cedecea sp. NFIX57 TaxID=1566286 RepID=UPI000A0B50C2|nr:hypothetical protein [Cedecea sp. NFIX57]SMG61417.1 hypothetical protein SAMN03159353_10476 [Cedecea sp. NFIX57]